MSNTIRKPHSSEDPVRLLRRACHWAAIRNIRISFKSDLGLVPLRLNSETSWMKDPRTSSVSPLGALILMIGITSTSDSYTAAEIALNAGVPFTAGVMDSIGKRSKSSNWMNTNAKERYVDGWEVGDKIRNEYDR